MKPVGSANAGADAPGRERLMTVSLFTFVGLYARLLTTASHLLTKAAEFAEAHGQSEAEMLDWRLIEDMQPLRFQLMVLAISPASGVGAVAGLPVPDAIADDLNVVAFHQAIAEAKAYLTALTPEQFAGRDDVSMTVEIGNGMAPTPPAASG